MKVLVLCLNLIFLSAIIANGQNAAEKMQKTADNFASAYNAKDYAAIDVRFNADMKTAVPPDKLKAFLDDLHWKAQTRRARLSH